MARFRTAFRRTAVVLLLIVAGHLGWAMVAIYKYNAAHAGDAIEHEREHQRRLTQGEAGRKVLGKLVYPGSEVLGSSVTPEGWQLFTNDNAAVVRSYYLKLVGKPNAYGTYETKIDGKRFLINVNGGVPSEYESGLWTGVVIFPL